MNNTINFLIGLLLLACFVIGVYVGAAGLVYDSYRATIIVGASNGSSGKVIEYDGIPFQNYARLKAHLDSQVIDEFYGWLGSLPSMVVFLISSCAFGFTGGIIRITADLALLRKNIKETQYIALPCLGFMLGLPVVAASYLFPSFLVDESYIKIRPSSLMFLSLFAGLYSKAFLQWLEKKFNAILQKEQKK